MSSKQNKLTMLDSWLFGYLMALVIIMPVHAFVAISLGSVLGHQAAWQVWKEVGLVLSLLGIGAMMILSKPSRQKLMNQPVAWLIAAFALTTGIVSLVSNRVGMGALLLGAKTSLEFLAVAIVAMLVAYKPERLKLLITSLLAVSSAVGAFAVAQVLLLPKDFLVHFGYDKATTVPSYHLVDPAVQSIRVIATLSGPNQLGSFMIIPLIISLWLVLRRRWLAIIPFLLTGFALWHSYSRSAWIGAVIAIFITLGLRLRGWWKLTLLAPIIVGAIIATNLSSSVRTMSTDLSYYVFHGQYIDGHENGSDQNRLENLTRGIDLVEQRPLGYGLGTAGPASNKTTAPIVTENFYAQIAIEAGVVGLGLFVAIIIATITGLWNRVVTAELNKPLIAILLGLSATNIFLHTWADSSTALIFWALAGYMLAAPRRKHA